MNREVRHCDNMDPLRGLPSLADNSVDSVVTDPPAGISFMGRAWDDDKGGRRQWIAWLAGVMTECLRVLKPGGHALVWSLPRTSHWTATALEDAGFEIRDVIVHVFGSGWPKSHDIAKAIDKRLGTQGELLAVDHRVNEPSGLQSRVDGAERVAVAREVRAPGSPEAERYAGWGTALKPAAEHWILARKPFPGTVVDNVLSHGTGGINVGGCKVGTDARVNQAAGNKPGGNSLNASAVGMPEDVAARETTGRWPANFMLSHAAACRSRETCADDCPVAELDDQSGRIDSHGQTAIVHRHGIGYDGSTSKGNDAIVVRDTGGASRFFTTFRYEAKAATSEKSIAGEVDNSHPTIKSVDLMRWLCRLVTPAGGTVVDPFAGSGTTGVACALEGFAFVGFELEEKYAEIATRRLEVHTRQQVLALW